MAKEKIANVTLLVQGDVQRAGYRFHVQDVARKLGVKGYVGNTPEGYVGIVGEAAKPILQQFIKKIRIKQPPIGVEEIKAKWSKATGRLKPFQIKYGTLVEEMTEGFGAGLKYINVSRSETKEGFKSLKTEIASGFKSMDAKYGAISETLKQLREDFHRLTSAIERFLEARSKPA